MTDRQDYLRGWPRWIAWTAHAFTALGLVLAAGCAVAIEAGGPEGFRWAFICLLLACLVDAVDGTLARKLHVKEVLPNFDGAKLDDIVDFLNYTALPLILIWHAGLLPAAGQWVLIVTLVASAYGFCQVPAKTTDGYFVGFPSYWNIVAFYLYVLGFPGWLATLLILSLALLTFVPSYYLYPSRGAAFSRLSNFLGGVWVVMLLTVLMGLPGEEAATALQARQNLWLGFLSLFYPIYYMALSWAITIARWRHLPFP